MSRESPVALPEPELPLAEMRLADLERFAARGNGGEGLSLRQWVALAEAWRIARALREHRGNRSATARALRIGRRTLYTKMERLGLVPSWGVRRPQRAGAHADQDSRPSIVSTR